MSVQLEQRLLTVGEYHRMAEIGILQADDRVELLNGQIIKMSPIGSRHAAFVEKIDKFLAKLLADAAMVRAQNPVVLDDFSEPEPDIAVVKVKENYYADQHPSPEDIFLIIEVADSSLEKDRQVKLQLYAAARIPEYWIVNPEAKEIEIHRFPERHTYRSRNIYFSGDEIDLSPFGRACRVDDLLI